MTDITNYLPILFLVLFLLLAFWVNRMQTRKRKDLLEHQAEKRGGEIIKGDWFVWPKLRLLYQGETLIIFMTPGNRYRPAKTHAQFEPQRATLPECRLVENGFLQRMMASLGRERILTHDEVFDARYTLTAREDTFMAARLVQGSAKEYLLKSNFTSLEIKTSPSSFDMNMSRIPRDDEDFDNFIETAFSIIQNLSR